ncbi:MAG: MBL fold metallo-hydrolase [Proteobacteria bacterium]|nr:MBL fold metallo-hydrolase [Pseudomonadota bacterium]
MTGTADRRRFLLNTGALALAAAAGSTGAWAQEKSKDAAGTKIVLLGTKGGPRVGGGRKNPATLLMIGGVPYVIDCGYGVSEQLVKAGVPLQNLRYIFFTHLHSDHNLEYGPLVYNAWATGLKQRVDAYGPKTLKHQTLAYFDSMKFDIDIRIDDEGKPDPRKLVVPHEFFDNGLVMENADVKVTATRVRHPPIADAYALRFDTKDRSVVISGDTNYSPELIELAKGADVLLHEVLYVPGLDSLLKRVTNAATLREHIVASHTTTEDVGRVAAAAGVKKLVLHHFVPGDDPSITDEMWTEGVRKHYSGDLVVGRDLMVI